MLAISRGMAESLLVVVGLLVTTASINPQPLNQHNAREFPCPEEEAVTPCECDYNDVTYVLSLNCDSLGSEEELADVFDTTFPFTSFATFKLSNSNISTLGEDTIRKLSFRTVVMFDNGMQTVSSGALANSYHTLETFIISEDYDDPYDWPVPDLKDFELINKLEVSGPYGDLEPLESASLTAADLSLYYLTTINADTFSDAPKLKTLTVTDTNLSTIAPFVFENLAFLEKLEITGGHLVNLEENSIKLSIDANLTALVLRSNKIETIDAKAIDGVNEFTQIDLSDNQLTDLNEEVFRTLLNQSAQVNVSDNPLSCGCDLAWVLQVSDAELNRLVGLMDACGLEGEYDAETIKDFFEYQCSNSTSLVQNIKHFFVNIFQW